MRTEDDAYLLSQLFRAKVQASARTVERSSTLTCCERVSPFLEETQRRPEYPYCYR
jgi:hypothetical protein